ncbi:MAG: hypothetical protein U0167_01845 [bacterium]
MTQRGWTWLAAAGAALVAVAFVLQPLLVEHAEVALPAAPIDARRVRPLSPIGSIPRSPASFVWSRDPDASAYQFQLLGRGGAVLFAGTTTDTTIRVPQGRVDWNIVATATWRVTPIGGPRSSVPSETVRFQLDTP